MARIVWASLLSLHFLFPLAIALADEGTADKPVDWEGRLEKLRSLPYVALSETVIDEGDTGVVLYDSQRACDGYNLYCTRFTGEAFLLDMHGRVVHRWDYLSEGDRGSYHHVVMLENGDLVVVKEYKKLLRVNWNSNLIWEKKFSAHHDVTPAPDGSFYAIYRQIAEHRGIKMWFAGIMHLTADGEEIDSWFSYDHLSELMYDLDTRSFVDTILDSIETGSSFKNGMSDEVKRAKSHPGQKKLDYFHMNTVSVLPSTALGERDSRFQPGNLLICLRNVNQIAVLEKDTYSVLWAWGEGQLQWPHDPRMLPDGHILIFDNGTRREYSRVVELDPLTGDIVWEYTAEPPEDFYSYIRGSAQRLSNGNTLICESDNGRVFEVSRQGEVVWMWLNPATKKERRQAVYKMLRLPKAQVDRLLEE